MIPAPAKLKYLPYQEDGILELISRRNSLLADEMGLGKTIQVAGAINALPKINNILIIPPANLKINWLRELNKWLVLYYTKAIAESSKDFPQTDIVIINYDILKKFHKEIRKRKWDLLVCDEAHYVKNDSAQRTQEVVGRKKTKERPGIKRIEATMTMMLTGTPLTSRPLDLWPLIHRLDPGAWPSFWNFVTRYCDAKDTGYGWDFKGASNLEELNRKLQPIMTRRLKHDVLPELPAKQRQVVELPAKGLLKAEQEFLSEQYPGLTYNEVVRRLATSKIEFDDSAEARHVTAIAKMPAVISHIKDALESVDKIVVFAWHRDVISKIYDGLIDYSPAVVTGETKLPKRQDAVDRFQEDPSCRVFLGNIQAAGVGITLTAAHTVVCAELDWTPGNMSQAEDRCHRIGQKDSVLVQHLVLEKSIDAAMAKILVNKQGIIDKTLNGGD